MSSNLFRQSFVDLQEQDIHDAVARVMALSERDIRDPALAGGLSRIAAKYGFPVATLIAGPAQWPPATRRKDSHYKRDYGQMIKIERTLVDVAIPFTGSRGSFNFAPSRCTEVDTPVTYGPNTVIFSYEDDDQLQSRVDDFVRRVSGNLDQLRQEMDAFRVKLGAEIDAAVKCRTDEIDAQRERDKTRSFRIA